MTRDDLQRLFPAAVVIEVATEADEDDSILHPAEQALTKAMVPARKREFAAGRNAARRALARLGFHNATLPRRPSSHDVLWPEGTAGSISHTRGLRVAACVRTTDLRSVGIDVEEAGPLGRDIVDAICRPEELLTLGRLAAPVPSDWPRLVFAMKEAAYKALYPLTRHMLDFHDARVYIDPLARRYRFEVLDSTMPGMPVTGSFSWNDDYVAASAVLS